MKHIAAIFLLFWTELSFAQNVEVLKTTVFPGGVIPIVITNLPDSIPSENIEAEFLGTKFNFFYNRGEAITLVPVPLTLKPHTYPLKVIFPDRVWRRFVTIVPYSFPERRMKFRPLSPLELRRYQEEKKELETILSKISKIGSLPLPFGKPLDNPLVVTSEFGTIRRTNGSVGRHWGADFKANLGEAVRTINSGRVVLAKEIFLGGNTVIIDHGEGIFSIYMHLAGITVKEGNYVDIGEIIGRAGSSGRATGVNLHLTVYIKGIAVNPIDILMLGRKSLNEP